MKPCRLASLLFAALALAPACTTEIVPEPSGAGASVEEPAPLPAHDEPADAPPGPPADEGDKPAEKPEEDVLDDGEPAPSTPPPSSCTDDGAEPNDAQAAARPLSAGASLDATICGDDEDWFSVSLGAGCAVSLSISFVHGEGDLDLALHAPDGSQVATSAGVTDGESVELTAPEAGAYAARVYPFQGAENAFSITASVECEDPPPAVDACPDDADGDGPGAAVAISQTASGTACSGDSDWYSLPVQAGCSLRASLAFTHAAGDLDLVLEDAAGARLDSSLGFTDHEVVEAVFEAAGSVRLGVLGYGSAENAYSLSVDLECGTPLTCPADDGWEPNDTAFSSLAIFDGETLGGIICLEDPDVWALWVDATCAAVVDLAFTHAEGDLDLAFFSPGGALMEASERATDGERVVEVANTSGEHFIRVAGYAGAENTYDVTVSTVCREDLACPGDDPFEPNDDQDAAVRLDAQDKAIGMTCGNDDWYDVDVQQGCTLTAKLSFSHQEGDLDLKILDAGGAVLASSSGTTDAEQTSTTAQSTGRLSIRVLGYGGAEARYLLESAVVCP